jgi:hypothetical protein
MQVNQLQSLIAAVEYYLTNQKGFDTVRSVHFEVHQKMLKLYFTVYDTFQDKLHYDDRTCNGLQSVTSESFSIDEIWNGLRKIPSRSLRELECVCRQSGRFAEMEDLLNDQRAREFAHNIAEARNAVAYQLRDERGLEEDEIPF